jgi:hypothetical protein
LQHWISNCKQPAEYLQQARGKKVGRKACEWWLLAWRNSWQSCTSCSIGSWRPDNESKSSSDSQSSSADSSNTDSDKSRTDNK